MWKFLRWKEISMIIPRICTGALYFLSIRRFPHAMREYNASVPFMKKPRIQTELNKMEILRHCYRKMAVGTWDAISVAELEAGMSKTRGAIFYFNKNKSELFINMIDELFFPIFRLSKSDEKRYLQCNVELFFSSYKTPFERIANDLRINYDVEDPAQKMFNIITQAQKLYPDFNTIIKTEINREIDFLNRILNPRKEQWFDILQLYQRAVGSMYIESF